MIPKPNEALRRARKKYEMKQEDARWSASVKQRAGLQCEKPGCDKKFKGLAAHHVFSRSNKKVRHYVPNGVCLCDGHHMFWAHKVPHNFRDVMTKLRGEAWWDDLRKKSNGQ
jgi:hypothetical protein